MLAMIVECAWCKLVLGETRGPVDAVSHGI